MNKMEAADPARGVYKICGKFWNVGTRYKLHQHIGGGSYGDVCRATDCQTSLTVALKRVGDVLCCPLLAKRVLREVCIMRRLSHPYIIALTDVFTSLSIEVDGGVDLYIATEFADGGDLYHLRQSITPQDVKFLMWQLLTGMSYIHSCRVWHRDVKSENILLMADMTVKICDFGLSRSAEESTSAEIEAGVTNGRIFRNRQLRRQYTKTVVTPSYRAPEVIMSRGQYGSSIDIWSVGCIFWELLIRSINPNMTGPPLRPLFGVREEPTTPGQGESYAADGPSPLHEQLDVIFDVIGTPGWSDIESVPSESWRSYLKHLPGRAGNLISQLCGYIDQEALDLLMRMLAFNPSRRCSAEEALSHTYFKGLERSNGYLRASFEAVPPGESVWKIKDPAVALDILERELEASVYERDGGRQKLEWLLQQEIEQQKQQEFFKHNLMASMHYLRQNAAVFNNPVYDQNHVLVGQQVPVQEFVAPQQADKRPKAKRFLEFLSPPITRSASKLMMNNNNESNGSAAKSELRRSGRSTAAKEIQGDLMGKRGIQGVQPRRSPRLQASELPRRSPRLRDLQAGELPHRKRLCLKAG